MKWIGQHIWDFISRFRSHVYFEDSITLSTGKSITMDEYTSDTVSITKIQDSGTSFNDNDTSLLTAAAIADKIEGYGYSTTSGDITGVTITTDSGGGATASDAAGSADFSILGATGVGVTNSGTTITATAVPAEIDHDSLQNFVAEEHVDWAGSSTGTVHSSNIPTLNQSTTGSAATLTTPRAINGVDFDGSAPITVTAAGSTLSDTVTVAKGGTGLTTVAANAILTGNGTGALTAEANFAFVTNRLTIGNGGEDIQPYLRFINDENTLELGVANTADDFVTGSADGDVVLNSYGDHNVIIAQNDLPALTIDTNSDSNFNRRFTVTGDTDGTYEGDVVYFGGTTSMTVGTIYHYKSDGTWEAANANAVATSDGLLGVALGAASDTNGMLLRGMVTLDHDPGAVGDVLFLSNTAGDASSTAPSDNNDIVRVIGYCLHASNGQIWFNPDGTFVEVTA